ncbi:alpha/beta fold hydrolase [Massilia putida]|uniref:alpha/beta fold hydrolase n=1 Tax=Massilia putida TaxID=1141883 RepID=UPI0009533A35|nr:alpha/beta hydrolase [Massilia putida]
MPDPADVSDVSGASVPDWFRRLQAQPPLSRRVDIAGASIHCVAWNMEHSARPLLLLVHGFLAHARWWDPLLDHLMDDYRIVAMEFSGMGDSGRRERYTVDLFAAEVIGVAEALAEGPLRVIGHSYGGARVLRACAERPDLFSHAIVIDSFLYFADDTRPAPPPPRPPRVQAGLDEAIARYRLLPPEPGVPAFTLAHVARHALRAVAGGWQLKFDPRLEANGRQEIDADVLLRRVRIPVDVVYGEHSLVVDQDAAARAVACLPAGRGPFVVRGGHHHLTLSHPRQLAQMLRDLLPTSLEPES